MAKLLTSVPSNILGASADLGTRYVRLRNDRDGGSWTPGMWETIDYNASPVSGIKPGGQTSVTYEMPNGGVPKKLERLLLRFDVVNAHATDVLATWNVLSFISGLRLFVNGHQIHHYQSSLELKLLLSEYLQKQARREDMYARLAQIRKTAYDQGTLSIETFAAASATTGQVYIDVLQLFPWLNNIIVSHPNRRVNSLKMEITFQPSVGSVVDGINFKNNTANTQLYNSTNVTFNNIRLVAWTSTIESAPLMQLPAALWPILKTQQTSFDMDLSSTATTKVVRLAVDLPRSSLIFRTYVLAQEIGGLTTYNDADAGGLVLSGPDWLRLKFKKTGAVSEVDLTVTKDAIAFHVMQLEMSNGHAPPMEIYDASGNLPETYLMTPAIDWRLVDNDASQSSDTRTELIGGLDTERTDYTLTINAATALSTNVRLTILNAYYELYTVADGGMVSRLKTV